MPTSPPSNNSDPYSDWPKQSSPEHLGRHLHHQSRYHTLVPRISLTHFPQLAATTTTEFLNTLKTNPGHTTNPLTQHPPHLDLGWNSPSTVLNLSKRFTPLQSNNSYCRGASHSSPVPPLSTGRNFIGTYINYLFGPDNARTRLFYLLPKIHKDPSTWTIPYEVPPVDPSFRIVTAHPITSPSTLHHTLKGNFQTLQSQHPHFTHHRIILAHRKNNSLHNILIRSKFSTHILQHYAPRKFIHNQYSHTGFPTLGSFSLESTNIVYIITCTTCHKHYVGETGHSILTRLKQHLYNIREGRLTTPLVHHFQSHPSVSIIISGLESNDHWTIGQRKRAEK
ncbi:hypothetical protein F7725_007336, partial [Dissostichus mawsoni]